MKDKCENERKPFCLSTFFCVYFFKLFFILLYLYLPCKKVKAQIKPFKCDSLKVTQNKNACKVSDDQD